MIKITNWLKIREYFAKHDRDRDQTSPYDNTKDGSNFIFSPHYMALIEWVQQEKSSKELRVGLVAKVECIKHRGEY